MFSGIGGPLGRGRVRKFHIIWSTLLSLGITLIGMFTMIFPFIRDIVPYDDKPPIPFEMWEKVVIFAIGFLTYIFAIKLLLFFRRPYLENKELRYS